MFKSKEGKPKLKPRKYITTTNKKPSKDKMEEMEGKEENKDEED